MYIVYQKIVSNFEREGKMCFKMKKQNKTTRQNHLVFRDS